MSIRRRKVRAGNSPSPGMLTVESVTGEPAWGFEGSVPKANSNRLARPSPSMSPLGSVNCGWASCAGVKKPPR